MTRGVWRTCALAVFGTGWAVFMGAQPVPTSFVEVQVRGVTVDPQSGSPVVLLATLLGSGSYPFGSVSPRRVPSRWPWKRSCPQGP